MNTEYARLYDQLIDVARTNNIQLVLANYSMAVNARSEADLIDFYRGIDPWVDDQIKANEVHTQIIERLGKLHAEITAVDTHPNFDGQHQYFVDLVHFTHGGDQRMAELFFAAIKDSLEKDCGTLQPAAANNPIR